jgi:hypothetical protein
MNTSELIQKMRGAGVKLYLTPHHKLYVDTENPLTAEQQDYLTKHESVLVEHLKSELPRQPSDFIEALSQRKLFDIYDVVDELCFIVDYHETIEPALGKTWHVFFKNFRRVSNQVENEFRYLTLDETIQLMREILKNA